MGKFSENVDALLQTYTRCLGLLLQLGGGSQRKEDHNQLYSTIVSSRSRVRLQYDTLHTENPKKLEKGDATARRKLRRLVTRLREAIDAVLFKFRRQPTIMMDYETLSLLSDRSSASAIKAMSELSSRSSARSVSTRTGARQGSKRSSTSSRHRQTKPAEQSRREDRKTKDHRAKATTTVDEKLRKRRSMTGSLSSNSTKLGEIRRKIHRDQPSRPAYPPPKRHTRPAEPPKKTRWYDAFM